MTDALKYQYDLDPDAVSNTAASIYRLAEPGGESVLDVGSGPGIVSALLHSRAGKRVTCVDLDEVALSAAREKGLETFVGDLEHPDVLDVVQGRSFDVIILADVLEHLRDPGRLLADIDRRGLLTDGGRLVISFPNATHGSVLSELVAGDFRYTTTGILDETHVRWFTLRSMTRLLEAHGYGVARVERTTRHVEHLRSPRTSAAVEAVAALTPRLPEVDTYQFVLSVRRMDSAGTVAALREQLDMSEAARGDVEHQLAAVRASRVEPVPVDVSAHEEEKAALRDELETVRSELSQVRRLLAEEQDHALDELRRAAQELEKGRGDGASARDVRALERRNAQLVAELNMVRSSESFRLGNRAVRTVKRARRLAGPRWPR